MTRRLTKVVVWGHPLHSHTHSYVHFGWVKALQYMEYDVYWFHAHEYPSDFDYTNTMFITECSSGADANIPLHASNVYFVHACTDPMKYISCGARLIDIRYHVACLHDSVYAYNLDEKIRDGSVQRLLDRSQAWYEPSTTSRDLNPAFHTCGAEYEALYMFWATDLLPHEINYNDRFIQPAENPSKVVFVGSIANGNSRQINNFICGCQNHNIVFEHINPWSLPVSFEENKALIHQSIIAPDIRGDDDPNSRHKTIGYIPCRLFKHISYGKLGATNCKRIHDLFAPYVLFHEDESQLVDLCLENRNDTEFIHKQMEWVAANHTYVNRVQDLVAVLEKHQDILNHCEGETTKCHVASCTHN